MGIICVPPAPNECLECLDSFSATKIEVKPCFRSANKVSSLAWMLAVNRSAFSWSRSLYITQSVEKPLLIPPCDKTIHQPLFTTDTPTPDNGKDCRYGSSGQIIDYINLTVQSLDISVPNIYWLSGGSYSTYPECDSGMRTLPVTL